MKINAKTFYASQALLALSAKWPNPEPLSVGVMSKNLDISLKFLNQILIALRKQGFVQSIKGKNGGYILSKSPDSISLKNLVQAFDSILEESNFSSGTIFDAFKNVHQELELELSKITFQNLLEREKEEKNIISYVI